MNYSLITITKKAASLWVLTDNTLPAGKVRVANRYAGIVEGDYLSITTKTGGNIYNQQPYSIFNYVDETNTSNNFTPISAEQLYTYLFNDGFFDDGSSSTGGASTLLGLDDAQFASYLGRNGQYLVVADNELGFTTKASELDQNNKLKTVSLGFTTEDITLSLIASKMNLRTTVVTATDTPVIITISDFPTDVLVPGISSASNRYIFAFKPGKGTYGSGGIAVTTSMIVQLSYLNLSPDDVDNDPNAVINNLDPVTDGDFVTKANEITWDFSDSGEEQEDGGIKQYYFTYTQEGVLYFALFTGVPGIYGLDETPFTEDMFVITTNDTVLPEKTKLSEFENDIPLAELSQLNGLQIEVNQAAAEMYLKNVDGDTLATVSLAFLNNEGTTFYYNSATGNLELKDDQGNVLSVVPVSAFVSNLIQYVDFNASTPEVLEFKSPDNTVIDSVTITINNVQGLLAALNLKAPLNSPALTGVPTAPTASVGTNTTQIATAALLKASIEANGWGTGLQNNDAYTGNVFSIATTQVVRVANSATNLPVNESGVLVSYFRSTTYGLLIFHADSGGIYYNIKNGAAFSTGGWKRTWSSSDFTTTDIANWNAKQAALVSGTNIKTVGGQSIVGSGNVTEVQNNMTESDILAPSVNAVLDAIGDISFDMLNSTETNINNYLTSGSFITPASSLTNIPYPASATCYLLVNASSDGNSVYQKIIRASDNVSYERTKNSGTWGSWYPVNRTIVNQSYSSSVSKSTLNTDYPNVPYGFQVIGTNAGKVFIKGIGTNWYSYAITDVA